MVDAGAVKIGHSAADLVVKIESQPKLTAYHGHGVIGFSARERGWSDPRPLSGPAPRTGDEVCAAVC